MRENAEISRIFAASVAKTRENATAVKVQSCFYASVDLFLNKHYLTKIEKIGELTCTLKMNLKKLSQN